MKKAKTKPKAKRKAKVTRIIDDVDIRFDDEAYDAWFTVDIGGVDVGREIEVRYSSRFDTSPGISFCDKYPTYSVGEILELAEVIKVLPKLKLTMIV